MGRVAQWFEAHVVLSLAMPSIVPKPERLAWPVQHTVLRCSIGLGTVPCIMEDDIVEDVFLELGLQHRSKVLQRGNSLGHPPPLPPPSGPITIEMVQKLLPLSIIKSFWEAK